MLNAGSLDRRVRIERKVVTRDASFNSEVVTWVEVCTVWASVLDVLGSSSEVTGQSLRLATGQTRVQIRYRDDVDRTMRVVLTDRNRTLQITDMAELGRRDGLSLSCEEFSA